MRNDPEIRFGGIAAMAMMVLSALPGSAASIVPSYNQLKSGTASEAELGLMLINDLNCVACHHADASPGRLPPKASPDLTRAGERLTPQYIRALLKDPQAVRPGTGMPEMFHGLADADADKTIEALTHFLVSQGGPMAPSAMSGGPADVDAGKKLFHEIGCVACHAPIGKFKQFPSVSLKNIERKTAVDPLSAFLKDPKHARPSGRMPDFRLGDSEARALAVYLLRKQLGNAQATNAPMARVNGVSYKYFEGNFVGREDALASATPDASGVTSGITYAGLTHARSTFAFVFEAMLRVDTAGAYRFKAASDDSSFVRINGQDVVSIPGSHPRKEATGTIALGPGSHELQVIYCDSGGQQAFDVQWGVPGQKMTAIPLEHLTVRSRAAMVPLDSENFTVDPALAKQGKAHFTRLRCVSCHPIPGVAPTQPPVPDLNALRGKGGKGCVAASVAMGHPRFDLNPEQRSAIRAGLKAVTTLGAPLAKAAQIEHTLAAFNCLACHTRDALGGAGDRDDYFHATVKIDLGDEGRLPPSLTGAGAKLRESALKGIISEGKHHVRPYMATRMPSFDHAAIDALIKLLPEVDGQPGDLTEPAFTSESAAAGRRLVGVTGLGCVNCHNIAGNKSIGIPGVDLATVYERLTPGWFGRFLSDPAAVNKNTRMPGFWLNGTVAFKDVADGTVAGQHAAIWNYLSLGKGMPLPKGIGTSDAGGELVPADEPILLNTFIKDAGPRGIAIGYPEKLHVSFDANKVRLTNAWKGRFFDPRGAWSARNGKFLGPLGQDVLSMPPGPSFAVLSSPDAPWPLLAHDDRFVGRFKGYTFDAARMPTLIYEQDGLRVEERPEPRLQQGGPVLMRRFGLSGSAVAEGMHFLAASGNSIEATGPEAWSVDGTLLTTVKAPGMSPFVRKQGTVSQLLVPLVMNGNQATLEVTLKW